MGKRILAAAMALTLAFALLPKAARAETEIRLSLAGGAAIVIRNGADRDTFTISQAGSTSVPYSLSDTSVRITGVYPGSAGSTNVPIHVNVSHADASHPLKIILDNVTITGPNGWGIANNALRLDKAAQPHVLLTLAGTSTLKSDGVYAAVHVPAGAALTIQGGGTLNATGGVNRGAGIGGNNANGERDCGSVTIHSGTVKATGFANGAGIGGGGVGNGGTGGSGGTITINGGIVTADGSGLGAGIGGGGASQHDVGGVGTGGLGGSIKINGGTVSAHNGYASAGSHNADQFGAAIGGGASPDKGRRDGSVDLSGYAQYEWAHTDTNTKPTAFMPAPYPDGQYPNGLQNAPGWTVIRPLQPAPDVPKTGDNTPIALLIGLMSLCGTGLVLRKKSRRI